MDNAGKANWLLPFRGGEGEVGDEAVCFVNRNAWSVA